MAISRRRELAGWILSLLGTIALYAFGAIRHLDLFGSSGSASPAFYVAAGAAVVVAAAIGVINPRRGSEGHTGAIAAALVAWPLFFLFRTNWLNADGNMLTPRIEADVPRLGAHLTHDEMLELFLHSRFWYYTHHWWGWSVVFSYQVVSCAAGAVFVYTVVRLARRLAPSSPWLFVAAVLGGGYMQLFFGDVENYTVTAAFVALYVLAACRYLAGEVRLWVPAVVLAVAVCFHLEAAWLWPSALYLASVSRDRRLDLHEAAVGAFAAGVIVAATFVYFQFNGLPLLQFFSSHAGHALRLNGVFAIGMPTLYYREQLILFLLLCPAALLGVALMLRPPAAAGQPARFLAIAAASLLCLQLIWRSQIGVVDDWNLYAMGGMLASVCIWHGVSVAAPSAAMRLVAAAVAAVGWLHTYAWILMNHQRGS